MSDSEPTREELAELLEALLGDGVVVNADVAVCGEETQPVEVEIRAKVTDTDTVASHGLGAPVDTGRPGTAGTGDGGTDRPGGREWERADRGESETARTREDSGTVGTREGSETARTREDSETADAGESKGVEGESDDTVTTGATDSTGTTRTARPSDLDLTPAEIAAALERTDRPETDGGTATTWPGRWIESDPKRRS